jgi:hypothetical protein
MHTDVNILTKLQFIKSKLNDKYKQLHILETYRTHKEIHRTGWSSDNPLDLCSGSFRFESRPEHRLSWLMIFVVFGSPSGQISEQYPDAIWSRCWKRL